MGNKSLKNTLTQTQSYSDSSEKFLLSFFDKPQSQKQKEVWDILNNNPPWPILYHLHPQREFILSWYPFKKDASLLEVGAGCGSNTGMLCDKVKEVIANELSEERAEVIKKRWQNKKNLKVIAGNFIEMNIKKSFDYITLIGVLEYQERYTKINKKGLDYDENSPYIEFLKKIKKYLKKDGTLLIAIENKLGLKYLAGGKEDHYGNLFESIENYPSYSGIKTFTKEEITEILNQAGFNKINFYYPFPDYKLPHTIISENSINKINLSLSSYLPINDLSNQREFLFNETIFGHLLKKEKILEKFSNSFLIEAKL
jgi:ubiquinone/menaquinone biosynthesis C-methylase UbiE